MNQQDRTDGSAGDTDPSRTADQVRQLVAVEQRGRGSQDHGASGDAADDVVSRNVPRPHRFLDDGAIVVSGVSGGQTFLAGRIEREDVELHFAARVRVMMNLLLRTFAAQRAAGEIDVAPIFDFGDSGRALNPLAHWARSPRVAATALKATTAAPKAAKPIEIQL